MIVKNLKKISDDLQNALLQIHTKEDMFNFLRDLLTEDEIIEFSQRLDIAQKLYYNISYKKIEKETWSSSTTIARVAKFLKGKFWGYRKIFEKDGYLVTKKDKTNK